MSGEPLDFVFDTFLTFTSSRKIDVENRSSPVEVGTSHTGFIMHPRLLKALSNFFFVGQCCARRNNCGSHEYMLN